MKHKKTLLIWSLIFISIFTVVIIFNITTEYKTNKNLTGNSSSIIVHSEDSNNDISIPKSPETINENSSIYQSESLESIESTEEITPNTIENEIKKFITEETKYKYEYEDTEEYEIKIRQLTSSEIDKVKTYFSSIVLDQITLDIDLAPTNSLILVNGNTQLVVGISELNQSPIFYIDGWYAVKQ